MKFSTHLLLPALLLASILPAGSRASSIKDRRSASGIMFSRATYNTPIFPVVSSTKMVAISGTVFTSSGPIESTISGLINVSSTLGSLKYKIEADSISLNKKLISSYTGASPAVLYANAKANLDNFSAPNVLTKNGSMTLTDGSVDAGISTYNGNLTINSSITFNDATDTTQVFIIRVNGNLNISAEAVLQMEAGSSFSHVYFQVSGTTTIGKNSFAPAQFISANKITLGMGAQSGILYSNGAISIGSGSSVNTMFDTDGDGIEDDQDDFPNQVTKSNNNFISRQTLAFEDLWPATGDFDMNDMVISFDYNMITNSVGNLVEIIGNYQLIATGGVLHNGFGVQFPMLGAKDIKMCYEPSPATNTGVQEALQDSAVVIFFSDMRKEMTDWNTLENATHFSAPTLYTVSFRVTKPIAYNKIYTNGFNPFIYRMSGNSRSEVHLPGRQPTSLADNSTFLKLDDNTIKGTKNTYLTKTGLPYVIMLPTSINPFQYPVETKDISKTYLHFNEWARSLGLLFPDWYSNTATGYRNNSNIYTVPATIKF